MRSELRSLAAGLAALVLACGCLGTPSGGAPELGTLYNRAARHHGVGRNPVVVIPGILGSRLVDGASGRVVWGAFAGDYADPGTPDGARLVALPMAEGAALRDLRDEVRPDGALDRLRVEFAGLPIDLNAYYNVLRSLGVGGYRDQQLAEAGAVDYGEGHFTCFQFSYDWRRDNVENARRLHDFLVERRAYVQAELARRFGVRDAPVKFDLIAHSMGGLVARYLLRYGDADLPADGSVPEPTWAGAALVDRAILIGTPNAGSAKAVLQLVHGAEFASILPTYGPAVLGTMPAVYQLLPRERHGALRDGAGAPIEGLGDPALWERMGWGLAAPDQADAIAELLPGEPDPAARRRIALDHLAKSLARARQFHAALDRPAAPPAGTEIFLVAGDAIPTGAVAGADPATGAVWEAERAPGDGTVTRASALMDERMGPEWTGPLVSPVAWTQVMFLFSDHLGLTEDPAFTDNVLYWLLEDPRRRPAAP